MTALAEPRYKIPGLVEGELQCSYNLVLSELWAHIVLPRLTSTRCCIKCKQFAQNRLARCHYSIGNTAQALLGLQYPFVHCSPVLPQSLILHTDITARYALLACAQAQCTANPCVESCMAHWLLQHTCI
eukprot:GHUV01042789.1.p1 GENE.GHUV01042789.1~~GHUV01042789.1.p1  ORF type:complete len:129 (+),score=14.22 GHUV01042789.1:156-542(+)